MGIEFPIIAKLIPTACQQREGSPRRAEDAPGPERSAVIVSFEQHAESPGDYTESVRGAGRSRGAESADPARRRDIRNVDRHIDQTRLPLDEKSRLRDLLDASLSVEQGDWTEFIQRVDQLVTLREALHQATQALQSEAGAPERLLRLPRRLGLYEGT